jgi:hypothetical protein
MFFVITTATFLNLSGIFNWKHWLATWWFGAAVFCGIWALLTMMWVHGLEQRYPIPMQGLVVGILGLPIQFSIVLFMLPKLWRKIPAFKTRMAGTAVLYTYVLGLTIFYWLYWFLFTAFPTFWQPVLAIMLPFVTEGLVWIMSKIGL